MIRKASASEAAGCSTFPGSRIAPVPKKVMHLMSDALQSHKALAAKLVMRTTMVTRTWTKAQAASNSQTDAAPQRHTNTKMATALQTDTTAEKDTVSETHTCSQTDAVSGTHTASETDNETQCSAPLWLGDEDSRTHRHSLRGRYTYSLTDRHSLTGRCNSRANLRDRDDLRNKDSLRDTDSLDTDTASDSDMQINAEMQVHTGADVLSGPDTVMYTHTHSGRTYKDRPT